MSAARGNGRRINAGRRFRPGAEAGTLVLIGGAASPNGEALDCFLDLTRAREGGLIVGLTTASGDPVSSAAMWRADFDTAGATNVELPIVASRDHAYDSRIAARIREADGIFLGGGDQVHLIATLSGTPVGEAIQESFCRGTTVCGTSAGAAAITETILAYGEPGEAGEHIEMYLGPGLGLLGFHTMIDTHFAARRRLHRLFVAIARNPELMGLGIDEDTALVVRGHLGRVVGAGGVTFVDGRSVRYDNADAVRRGEEATLTLSYLRVGLVGSGHVLNLRERELEAVVNPPPEDRAGPTPTVTSADVEDSSVVRETGARSAS